MSETTDGPSLLSRAGFTLTTVDIEEITINYPSIWELLHDIRDMGESNAILGRRANISRDVLIAAEAIYKELYQTEGDGIPATFQVIAMVSHTVCTLMLWLTSRLAGSPDRMNPRRWQGVQAKRISKTSCSTIISPSHNPCNKLPACKNTNAKVCRERSTCPV